MIAKIVFAILVTISGIAEAKPNFDRENTSK